MNVMQRPLFRASGGEAFPDLSGDGKVTQKDILMGRGVIPRGMEEGGLAALMPGPEAAMMQEGMADPAMMEGGPLNPAEAAFAGDILGAREEGEQMGLGYLAQTMDGIDNASNTEELINSIRGKAQPLEARVQELATFVGEEDAMRTPESVLTMVQPVIMMTEEGAIDSGVGELIQGVMGDTEMSPEMGQGVGALMAQGQPAPEMVQDPMAQPVQQFYQGGAVKKFVGGGGANLGDPLYDPNRGTTFSDASIREDIEGATAGLGNLRGLKDVDPELYDVLKKSFDQTRAPRDARTAAKEYQTLMEEAYDMEGQRAFSDREAGLDLARAGFAFASGRDPKTGENMAGRGFLAQVGSVGQQYAESVGERLARERKGEQALRLSAIQQGIGAEQRDQEAVAREREQAAGILSSAVSVQQRLRSSERISGAQITAAGNQFRRQLGFNGFNAKANRAHQEKLMDQADEIKQKQMGLQADLKEASDKNNFGRTKELQDRTQANTIELTGIEHELLIARQLEQFNLSDRNSNNALNLQSTLQQATNEQLNGFAKELNAAKREFDRTENYLNRFATKEQANADRAVRKNYQEGMLALAQEEYALKEGSMPDIEDSYLYSATEGVYGTPSEARTLREIEKQRGLLQNSAIEQGLDQQFFTRSDKKISNYINLSDLALRKEAMMFTKNQAVNESLAAAGIGPQFGTTAEQTSLLGNNRAIKAYAQGLDVPGFDLSLNNMFGTVVLDNVGNQVPARALTPALRAAMDQRQKAGFAVPRIQGFANGGEADMSQGYLEPVTGYRFPIDQPQTQQEMLPEVMQRSYQPSITQDIEDITAATGARDQVSGILGTIGNVAANIAFDKDAGFSQDVKQAKKAVETLGTIATTTLMAAIPGKDNVELQRMLKNLQVPADSFTLQDDEALDYFRLARNTMELGIDNQLDLLQNSNLTRKEMTKVQTDLAQMNSIQAEYDNVIKAYETKLLPSEEVFAELDKFFK